MLRTLDAETYASLKRKLWLVETGLTLGLWYVLLQTDFIHAWALELQRFGNPLGVACYVASLGTLLVLLQLPFAWLKGYWIEHQVQLSNQTLHAWIKDWCKATLAGGIIGLGLALGLFVMLHKLPHTWWLGAALGFLVWTVLLTRLAPILLIPLFYEQVPLKDKALKERLSTFMKKVGTPVSDILELNLSKTTKKSNACLCGMGKTRRVLLSDTLLAEHTPDEIESVLAHEVGHHKYNHIRTLLLVSTALILLSSWCIHLWVIAPGHFHGELAREMVALLHIGFWFSLVNLISMPLTNGLSRVLERQADRYALEYSSPEAFAQTMEKLGKTNLAETHPPAWVEWFFHDHPAIGKRIAMAKAFSQPHTSS